MKMLVTHDCRTDAHFAVDVEGELYIVSKSDSWLFESLLPQPAKKEAHFHGARPRFVRRRFPLTAVS
jgi:hypothetical protein